VTVLQERKKSRNSESANKDIHRTLLFFIVSPSVYNSPLQERARSVPLPPSLQCYDIKRFVGDRKFVLPGAGFNKRYTVYRKGNRLTL
jgi:hypothetical protein